MSKSKKIERSGGSTARVVVTTGKLAVTLNDDTMEARGVVSEVDQRVRARFELIWWRGQDDELWEVRVYGPNDEWLDLGVDDDKVNALLDVAESLLPSDPS